MLTSSKSPLANPSKLVPAVSEEDRLKQQRMKEVLLLLDSLFEREEATVKMILDCLYDVGSVNLINQKFRRRPLNRLMKAIARLSKPAFRLYAIYWFKKNCPQLITNWLGTKVRFK
jgi:hypothetical protein